MPAPATPSPAHPHQGRSSALSQVVPQWVAQQFYRHGLFCSSQVYSGDAKIWIQEEGGGGQEGPRWAESSPVGYIQQVVIKAAVHPYTDTMVRSDAFRGPLATAFKLHLSDVAEYFDRETGLDMDHECLRTDGLAPRYRSTLSALLPDYGCLVLSPANIWRRDSSLFQSDANLVDTVFQLQRSREGHSSLADLMFGLRQRDTGITKQRTITYSVTVVLRQNKPQFVSRLRRHLHQLYPLHAEDQHNVTNTVHIFFPEMFSGAEYIPYTLTILLLFIYVYYSFSKIDLVNSKFGIALTAVITVLSSLLMSLGLTGLSLGASDYVYLVPFFLAALGLENMLVVTRSIVSSPQHLDVKVRIAQGLSHEGWNITKNLFSEITVLTLGFFLGILDTSIRDFCLLAVMGLLTDFFLQTFFFLTVLSMDINRTRMVDLVQKRHLSTLRSPMSGPGMKISAAGEGEWLVAPPITPAATKPSRRLRIVNFWAQRRVVSRLFIAAMVGWISVVIYQTGVVEHVITLVQSQTDDNQSKSGDKLDLSGLPASPSSLVTALHSSGRLSAENISSIFSLHPARPLAGPTRLQHRDADYWRRLPYSHWPMLFGLYNISVYGRHVVLLPPILLSTLVSPEAVVKLRSPNQEAASDYPAWTIDKIKSALDLGEEEEAEDRDGGPELSPFVPTSPGELVLAVTLAVPSILFLVYLSTVCYRVVCSRNYARWRAREAADTGGEEFYTEIVQEGAPVCLAGHTGTIETLVTDGHLILSHCLGGRIVVWDSLTGEEVTRIDRARPRRRVKESGEAVNNFLPKKRDLSGAALRRHLVQRRTKSEMFNKFSDIFTTDLEPAPDPPQPGDEARGGGGGSAWCLDMADGLVAVGCDDGTVELWDCCTGQLKCQLEDSRGNGATHLKILAGRVVVARLDGHLDWLDIVTSGGDLGGSAARARVRLISTDSSDSLPGYGDQVSLAWAVSCRAHSQPISCVGLHHSRLVTGSADHTVRVFRADTGAAVYTLHGHAGPVTALFLDRHSRVTAGSASQDGLLCVWDLLTGACMYSVQAHSARVADIAYSPGCVVTLGEDDKLCVWERHQGHLLNCVDTAGDSLTGLVMVTHNILVTASGASLLVWDVRLAQPVKIVRLGGGLDTAARVTSVRQCGDTLICAVDNMIKLVKFPILTQKID